MDDTLKKNMIHTFRGELALAIAVTINSFGVVLMLYSSAGISAISSVPFAFSEVFSKYFSWYMDLFVSGIISAELNDIKEKIYSTVSI